MINNIKLGYDDISIVPECVSNIRSRKECSVFTETLSLPIFAAPVNNGLKTKLTSYVLLCHIQTQKTSKNIKIQNGFN